MQYPFTYLAEFTGTLFVVFVIIYSANPIIIGAAFALISFARLSVNPAVTIATSFYKQKYDVNFDMMSVIPIIVAQCLGALAAIEIYKRVH
jgi:glycerol uptake facilitator-like aquaporin